MSHRPVKENVPFPQKPFDSENQMAEEEARVLREQRERQGLPMQPADNPIRNDNPFRNLTGR